MPPDKSSSLWFFYSYLVNENALIRLHVYFLSNLVNLAIILEQIKILKQIIITRWWMMMNNDDDVDDNDDDHDDTYMFVLAGLYT